MAAFNPKELLSPAYLEARAQSKILFKQGKLQEAFEFIEQKLYSLAKTHLAEGKENAIVEVVNALILESRLR